MNFVFVLLGTFVIIGDGSHDLELCCYLVSFLHRSTLTDHNSLLLHVLHVALDIVLVLDIIASDLNDHRAHWCKKVTTCSACFAFGIVVRITQDGQR